MENTRKDKILVVNAGSSSLKYQVIDMEKEVVLCKGGVERIGQGNSKLEHKLGEKKYEEVMFLANHTEALKAVLEMLTHIEWGVIQNISQINAIGHRVLHTGEDFDRSVLITPEVIKILQKNVALGPLHMPANIACVKACQEVLPKAPMVAVFDTAFHMTMPQHAYMYAIPYDDYKTYKVRRYGFHGTSHKYVSEKAGRMLIGKEDTKVITCHLGNGASIAAVRDGKCIDTSMGLTPLEGLVMGTRSGDIDPACLEYIMEKKGFDIHQMVTYLNKECGYLGISGISSDSRDIIAAMDEGNKRAKLAFDMSVYRIKKYIGAYTAAMGGLDCVVFTGGIGENSWKTRENVMRGLEYLGIDFDFELNKATPRGSAATLSTDSSKVKVFVIPTNEELVIARETLALT